MRIIDSLPEIQDMLIDSTCLYDLAITLIGNPAQARYPMASVKINNVEQWQGQVTCQKLLFKNVEIHDPAIEFEVTYTGKSDHDTVVEGDKIVENQHLEIQSVGIDTVNLAGYDLIELSRTTYDLTESQKSSYNKIQAQWVDVKTNTMYNNGTWKLKIKKPVLSTLIKSKQISMQVFEVSHTNTLSRLQQSFQES